MNKLDEIKEIASKISLTLDHPQSVKLQVKQISLAQKQLRAIKKDLNTQIRNINSEFTQSSADSIISVGLDLFGKRKLAGTVRAETRRLMEIQKKTARQPYIELKAVIDNLILEGDKLKLLAEEYLLNH